MPDQASEEHFRKAKDGGRACLAALGVVLSLCLASAGCHRTEGFGESGRSSQSSSRAVKGTERKTLLEASPLKMDFGDVQAGGSAEGRCSLHNRGPGVVKVRGITTTCGCFRVTLSSDVVGPGKTVEVTVAVDFRDEPGFVGALGLEAVGESETKTPAFVIRADVNVKRRAFE